MSRFYEVKERFENLEPINTNIHVGTKKINLIIVCESPSTDEVEKGYPAVSLTGARIFDHLVNSNMITSADKYSFNNNYQDFEENGIYLTNLVRYQADLNIKGSRTKKDQTVKTLWTQKKEQLFSELRFVATKTPDIKVLLACGAAFKAQLKEVTTFLNGLGVEWFITSHPSRSKAILSDNYNPDYWHSNEIIKTKLMESIEGHYVARR